MAMSRKQLSLLLFAAIGVGLLALIPIVFIGYEFDAPVLFMVAYLIVFFALLVLIERARRQQPPSSQSRSRPVDDAAWVRKTLWIFYNMQDVGDTPKLSDVPTFEPPAFKKEEFWDYVFNCLAQLTPKYPMLLEAAEFRHASPNWMRPGFGPSSQQINDALRTLKEALSATQEGLEKQDKNMFFRLFAAWDMIAQENRQ